VSFSEALQQRRLLARPYLEFSGLDNPSISGYIGVVPHRFGFIGDNTGAVPAKGTALSFGTFSRALANDRLSIETPRAAIKLADHANQWKRWASDPWVLSRSYMEVGLNMRNRDGTHTEGTVFSGLAKDLEFDGGEVAFTLYDTFGELFNETIPADRVDLDAWPFAHANAIGRPYPIIYGKQDNSLDYVQNVNAVLSTPSGAVVTSLTATPVGGGTSIVGTYTYAVAPMVGGLAVGAPVTVTVNVTDTTSEVDLAWSYAGPATEFVVYVTTNDFQQYARRYTSTNSLTDETPGYQYPSTLTALFDLVYRATVHYYVSATVAGVELTTGPVPVPLTPLNYEALRYVDLTWDEVPGATAITVRRALQTYHWDLAVDKQWVLAGDATSHIDWLNDTTPAVTTEPPFIDNTRPGAVACLYVDTNIAGTTTYRYVVARGAVKLVKDVFVTRAPLTTRGTPRGSIARPSNITATVVGTTGSVKHRYKVTAVNPTGETTASTTVTVDDGIDLGSMGGSDYNLLATDAVEGATSYRVYRAEAKEDFGFIFEGTNPADLRDTGYTADMAIPVPEENTTGDSFETAEAPVRAYPMRQTEGSDYTLSTITHEGKLLTVIDFYKDQGDNDVTANVWGVETVGDSSGELITGFFLQFYHFLVNFVFENYLTGPWETSSPYVDEASFIAAQTASETRVTNGYIGAGALTEAVEIRQAIYDWVMCTDADLYYWDGALKINLPPDPEDIDLPDLARLSLQDGILDGGFRTRVDDAQVYTTIPWRAGPQADGFRLAGTVTNDTGVERYGIRNAPLTSLTWLRDLTTIADVVERRRIGWAAPRVYAAFKAPLRYAMTELTSPLLITHPDGLSASENGWVARLVRLVRTDVDLTGSEVHMTVEDLGIDA
jgi:hypothetical protein